MHSQVMRICAQHVQRRNVAPPSEHEPLPIFLSGVPRAEHSRSLYELCRVATVKRIVAIGASEDEALAMARGLHESRQRRGGLLVCADTDQLRLRRIARRLARENLEDYLLACHGDARTSLRSLEGPIDLVWLGCSSLPLSEVRGVVLDGLRPRLCVLRGDARLHQH